MRKFITFLVLGFFATPAFGAELNEIRISSPGAGDDTSNFVEISGAPGESLDGLTLVSVSSEFEPGEVSFVVDLAGQTIPADGFFLVAADTTTYAGTDLATGNDYFGSPQVFALLDGFTGAQGDDYDTDNDGMLDLTPFTAIVDGLGLIDGDENPDFVYGSPTVGPDGSFPPAHVFRPTDSGTEWAIGLFGDFGGDSPGVANVPEPNSALMGFVALLGIAAIRRRK